MLCLHPINQLRRNWGDHIRERAKAGQQPLATPTMPSMITVLEKMDSNDHLKRRAASAVMTSQTAAQDLTSIQRQFFTDSVTLTLTRGFIMLLRAAPYTVSPILWRSTLYAVNHGLHTSLRDSHYDAMHR